jgi:uncharacterized protein YjeT (DUF2065 family)
MMHDTMVGIFVGCVLVALGLIPGLFDRLTRGTIEGVRSFRDSLLYGSPVIPRPIKDETLHRPVWLAGMGALLITITILAWLSK